MGHINIDMHYPTGLTGPSYWFGKLIRLPYGIPYRCLYSKNVPNLLMAGRNISATHVAFGSSRVMGTCSVLGQAAGNAAALCIGRNCLPDDVYTKDIEELQQRLLAQDCYLPGLRDQTSENLTRTAKVNAYSERVLAFAEPREYRPLDIPRGQAFVVSENRLDRMVLELKNTSGTSRTITANLRAMERLDDFTQKHDLKTVTADVPPGQSQVSLDFEQAVDPHRAYWVCIETCEDVAWGYSDEEPPATQATHLINQYFTEPGTDMFMQRVRGSYCLELQPQSRCYSAAELLTGVTRPEFRSNEWISEPSLPQWVDLSWEEAVEIAEVHLTFDNRLDRPLPDWTKSGHPAELVKAYAIQVEDDGELRTMLSVDGNVQRKRVHAIEPVKARRLRVCVNGTYGADHARLFEIRVYGGNRDKGL